MSHKVFTRNNQGECLDSVFEKRNKKSSARWQDHDEEPRREGKVYEKGFTCVQCKITVATSRELSGVNNRNHCPRCLWSKHVDEVKAGDRKAECKSRMQPIGLTVKQSPKRYNHGGLGELMLIHHCTGCGKLSINRIAADDDASVIYQVFNRSLSLIPKWKVLLAEEGIRLLGSTDLTLVYSQLFGWQSILEEFEPHGIALDDPTSIPFEPNSEKVELEE
jgi:hypothetical protein